MPGRIDDDRYELILKNMKHPPNARENYGVLNQPAG